MDAVHGLFLGYPAVFLVGSVLTILLLGFANSPLWLWSLMLLGIGVGFGFPYWLLGAMVAVMVVFNLPPLRTKIVSQPILRLFKKFEFFPKISETERTALEAGVVWVEKDLFSGRPNFKEIMAEPYPNLTPEERAFVDGPVDELCRMIQPWKVWKTREIDEHVWEFIRKKGFLGMIIPKEYGGLGFSALCHSEVVMRISARSVPVGVTIMVPNSLGPAELLVHYGTDAQKNHYLPRLARGEEMPCFGLTEPTAGSDAGSITSTGVLFRGQDGKMYLRLNWNKRWITLAAISTVLGLAFRLRDPENLLGKGEDVGITCALIPTNTPGVVVGRRHDPLGVPFYNCPTQGKDVIVPLDAVVGGADGVGLGWQMLMDCLSAGRGISLPAQAAGGSKLVSRVVSAHALIRKQFGVSIGRFEGVEEPLGEIGAKTYALEAMRRYTAGALDKGIKPPVVTAILKYYSTEFGRKIINHAMDIMGGAGISLGPRNLIAEIYVATPIGITVEGANILTRTLMVFGQGALRAHPYAYQEVKAYEANDAPGFDRAFWGHMGHIISNFCRSICLSWSRGLMAATPDCDPATKIWYRRLSWASSRFAILADVAMGSLGGQLKIKEKITGRFADVLAYMYIGVCVLRRYEAEGRKREDLPFVHYCLKDCFFRIQEAFDGIYDNMKVPGMRWLFRGILGSWSRLNPIGNQASDGWSHAISSLMLVDGEVRNRLTEGLWMPKDPAEQMARLENAFRIVNKAEAAEKKIRSAIKAGVLPKAKIHQLLDEAKNKNVISTDEYQLIQEADTVRYDAIQVDDFSDEQYHAPTVQGSTSPPTVRFNEAANK